MIQARRRWPTTLFRLLLALLPAGILPAAPMIASPPLEGKVVDMQTAKPVPGAVVSALWFVQPQKKTGTPLLLEYRQVRCDVEGRFKIPPWRNALSTSTQTNPAVIPLLRIYATGYQRMELISNGARSAGNGANGQQLKLRPLAQQGGNTLVSILMRAREKELVIWRNDVDTVAKSSYWHGDTNKALVAQAELIRLIAKNCLLLEPDRRQQICLTSDSKVAEYLRTTRLELAAQTTLQPAKGMLVAIPTADPEQLPPESRNRVIWVHPPAPVMLGAPPQ